jgi:pimeloyl-ACP methyl ester carboxylesterase
MRFAIAAAIGLVAVAVAFARPDAPAISHEYAEVNGVRLHYAKAGKGPLMVFLHGFPEFWYEWKNQIAEFSRDHTVVAPDMRGYNLSSKPKELSDYQMPKLVEDVRALTSHLLGCRGQASTNDPNEACPRFTLVAHDWGGVVAWVFAAQHPEMLDKLVIVNAPHPTVFGKLLREDAAQQQASSYMLMFRGPQAEDTLSADGYARLTSMVLGAGLKDGTVTEADRKMYVDAWSQPGALTGGLNYYRSSGIGPPASASAQPQEATAAAIPPIMVRVPTLVIWGEKDTALLTGNLNGLDQVVPKLTVTRIPEGTHWVVREKPADVNRIIREFLAQP